MERHAREAGAHVLGRIPYDEVLANTMARGSAAGDEDESPATLAVAEIRRGIVGVLDGH